MYAKRSAFWPKKVVGLTGGIATGKSTVMQLFREMGFLTVDTDTLANEATRAGQKAFDKIVNLFGKEILDKNGELDKKKLRDLILKDEDAKKQLEAIVHPHVFRKLDRLLTRLGKSGIDTVIVEVPLLFEAGWEKLFDIVILVTADREIQLNRLLSRTPEAKKVASKWIEVQSSTDEKVAASDIVIDNSSSLEELRAKIREISSRLSKV